MIRAAGLALFSALLGGAIALLARKRPAVLERTRTFAFAAAAGVVAFHLLPEVLQAQGLRALLWMGFGFALPLALEAGARVIGPGLLEARGLTGLRVAAEVGFAALLFHSVAEGLALVAALAQPRGQLDLEIALVAHHAPLTAAVVLPFLGLSGPGSAWRRAVLVGLAGVAGALLSDLLPGFGEGAFLTAATAATAGALLHVVSDEIRAQKFASVWERTADLSACLSGLAVAGLSAVLHLRSPEAGPLVELLRVFGGVVLACAPALLGGALVAALLALPMRLLRWDALLLLLVLLGPLPAVLFGTLSLLLALPARRIDAPRPPVFAGLLFGIRQHGPPLLLLLAVAAALEVTAPTLPAGPFSRIVLALALLFAARLDQAGAVAVAAVLVRRGFDPGLAIALVALGPATSGALATLRGEVPALRRGEPGTPRGEEGGGALDSPVRRGALDSPRGAVRLAIFAALALGTTLRPGLLAGAHPSIERALDAVRGPLQAQVGASPLGAAAAALLFALGLVTLWKAGVRGWFAPLRHGAARG